MRDDALARPDFAARVYAGVLGKIIGVYLGRPVEMWSHAQIEARFGEVRGYLAGALGLPLVVVDDDISGTFAFLRAARDATTLDDVSSGTVGRCWLNALVENRTTLWWGGVGNSTEHSAYRQLRAGVPPPRSGSAAANGEIAAHQVGAQIFVDGWAMLAAGDAARAAALARLAASVSHDGLALDAAAALAAMQAHAFVEPDIDGLFDAARAVIPHGGTIRAIHDLVREAHAGGQDWRGCRAAIEAQFGPGRFRGNCHIVPNHAVVAMAVRYGEGDFSRAVCIAVAAGWDTDSSAGNVGCLLGIRNGLSAFDGPTDWRTPVADRLYVVSADGASAVTDALATSTEIVREARRLRGAGPDRPAPPRYAFSQPGAVQGFEAAAPGGLRLSNPDGRGLRIAWPAPVDGALALTPTFMGADHVPVGAYSLELCPAAYPGERLVAVLAGGDGAPGAEVRLAARYGLAHGRTLDLFGDPLPRNGSPGEWAIPDRGGAPIVAIGLAVRAAAPGTIVLRSLDPVGLPRFDWRPDFENALQGKSWLFACDHAWGGTRHGSLRIAQDAGMGQALYGRQSWRDIAVEATLVPWRCRRFGLLLGVRGLRRHVAIELDAAFALSVARRSDEHARTAFRGHVAWSEGTALTLRAELRAERLSLWVDGRAVATVDVGPAGEGAVGLFCDTGTLDLAHLRVEPAPQAAAPPDAPRPIREPS